MSKDEVWLPVHNCPFYEISNKGRVRSLKRGTVRILKQTLNDGYYRVVFSLNGKVRQMPVHRMVCVAFHGQPPTSKHHAAHEDGGRTNNDVENISWKTPKQNHEDRRRHGTYPNGQKNSNAILTNEAVRIIRAEYSPGKGNVYAGNVAHLAARFGVSKQAIHFAATGRSWKILEEA